MVQRTIHSDAPPRLLYWVGMHFFLTVLCGNRDHLVNSNETRGVLSLSPTSHKLRLIGIPMECEAGRLNFGALSPAFQM